jgi:Secretion system C-terminal sorting domain
MKKTLTLLGIIFYAFQTFAQIPPITWYKTFGDIYEDEGIAIVTDKNGNVYSMSLITNRQDVNTDTLASDTLFLGAQAEPFTIIQKLDSTGKFIWAKGWRCYNANNIITNRMCIDKNGNIIFSGIAKAGTFSPPITQVDFDPDATQSYYLPSLPSGEFYEGNYIIKINGDGQFKWVKALTNTAGVVSVSQRGLAVDDAGNIFSTGSTFDNVDYDPSTAVSNLNAMVTNGYIQKLDSNGNFVWAQLFTCPSFNYVRDIAVDHLGNCFIVGENAANTDMDGGTNTTSLSAGPYIAKYNASGALIWAKPLSSKIMELKIGSDNSIYATGDYLNKDDMNPDPTITNIIDSVHTFGGYILKLSNDATYIWSKPIVSKSAFAEKCYPLNLKIDKNDNLYLLGTYEGTIDFNPEPPINALPVSFNGQFIAKYDSSGKFKWTKQVNYYQSSVYSKGYNCDNFGNVFLSGSYGSITAIDNTTTFTSVNINDAFIVKVRGVNATISTSNKDLQNATNVEIYPNPSNGIMYLKSKTNNIISAVHIYNMMGATVWQTSGNNSNAIAIDATLPKGIYQLQIINTDKTNQLLSIEIE